MMLLHVVRKYGQRIGKNRRRRRRLLSFLMSLARVRYTPVRWPRCTFPNRTPMVVLMEGRFGGADVIIRTSSAATIQAAAARTLRGPEGSGVLSISGIMDYDALRATKDGVWRVIPAMADPIFNTQPFEDIMRARQNGEPSDNRRCQAVMNPRWASTAFVLASLDRLWDPLFHVYGGWYFSSEPKMLLTMSRASPRISDGDAAEKEKLENPPRNICVVMDAEDGSHLNTWPGSFRQFVEPGQEQCAVRTCLEEREFPSVEGFNISLGDMVHRGFENASLNVILRRIHAFLTLCDAPIANAHGREETCPVKEVP